MCREEEPKPYFQFRRNYAHLIISLTLSVRSISLSSIEGFFWKFAQMFEIPRRHAKLSNDGQKVTLQGQFSNGINSCPLYKLKKKKKKKR